MISSYYGASLMSTNGGARPMGHPVERRESQAFVPKCRYSITATHSHEKRADTSLLYYLLPVLEGDHTAYRTFFPKPDRASTP